MAASPYISSNYRPQRPGPRLWLYAARLALIQTPIPETNGMHIDLAPIPKRIGEDGVVEFTDNGRREYCRIKYQKICPDIVILCTGYNQAFPFFKSETDASEYPTASEVNVRDIWKREDPSIGFIGFVRPSLGAIPPLAEMQAQLWILNLLAPERIKHPLQTCDESHYRLVPGARIPYGVDHESYAYQLALDMGSAPGLMDIFQRFQWHSKQSFLRLLIIWALGANFNTKFRLQGPWKWDHAQELFVSDEFWLTITRRPILFGKCIKRISLSVLLSF